MGRSIASAVLAAALWLALPLAAHAAGLGRLTVLSSLGQPLNAEIEIVALQPGEEEGLVARLAPLEAFQQAGIELSPALVGMRFTVERRQKRAVLRVTTAQPVNEPFVDVLVELQSGSARLIREYTVLLDPPEYKPSRPAIAAAPPPPPAVKPAVPEEVKPAPALEAKPLEAAPAAPPAAAPEAAPVAAAPAEPSTTAPAAAAPAAAAPATAAPEAVAPAADAGATHEVIKGDTLGAIARRNLPPGVSLNQMLIALYRANEDAFIRGNINLVRAGRILRIPSAEDALGAIDREAANELVKTHAAQFAEYRSRLAALPTRAETAAGQREAAGRIESKPEAAPPAAQDQVRLSKADPKVPATPSGRAAREDDSAARERALKESQSRVTDLEKNVADLQKLLEIKNQQLAELEKKAGAKPAPAPAAPPPAPAAKAPEQPAVVPEAPKPAAEAPKPAPPAAAKPKPKPAPPPPPQKSLIEEYAEDPLFLGALGLLVLLLVIYGIYSWRRKKAAQTKFQDSVVGAAAAGAAAGGASLGEPAVGGGSPAVSQASVSQAPAGMEAEEVDPIAEADVYMAYGRDAQAEEILKEALQKDGRRTAVHAKLLEIYASRKDTQAFEQAALKFKNLTNGAGPEWEKAAALGRSIDPQNASYGAGSGAARMTSSAPSAPAPALDFDLGGPGQAGGSALDISLGEPAFDQTVKTVATPMQAAKTMEFRLDDEKPQAAAPPAPAGSSGGGLDFDLKLDISAGDQTSAASQAPVDLGSISLDLGSAGEPSAASSADPKWQEVATKLDLAKAYQEMGDKNGARELLNEVIKDGDAAQKGQAQQLLAKLA